MAKPRLTTCDKTVIDGHETAHIGFGPVIVHPYLLMKVPYDARLHDSLDRARGCKMVVKTLLQYDKPFEELVKLVSLDNCTAGLQLVFKLLRGIHD